MNISNCTSTSLRGSRDMAPMQAEAQSAEVANNVLSRCSASPPGASLPESRNINSRDVINTKDGADLIQLNSESVEQQAATVEARLSVTSGVGANKFTTMDWFEVFAPSYYRNLVYFHSNEKYLKDLSSNAQGIVKKYLAVCRSARKGSQKKIPEIIMKVIASLFFVDSMIWGDLSKSITNEVAINMLNIDRKMIDWLNSRDQDELFTLGAKAAMKKLESYARDFICDSYYSSFYYFIGYDQFEDALKCLEDATSFIEGSELMAISSEQSRISLCGFYLYDRAGDFNFALSKLNESEDNGLPQAIWNSAIIDMGLCKSYRRKSNPGRAFKKLRSIQDKTKKWRAKNKTSGLAFRQEDIQNTIITIWNDFKDKTILAEDFSKARDCCFKMIASIEKEFADVSKNGLTILHLMGKEDLLGDPMLTQLVEKIYPASDCGREKWQKMYYILHCHLKNEVAVECYPKYVAEMKDCLMGFGVHEDLIDQYFAGITDTIGLQAIMSYNYDLIVNYIAWVNTVKKKRKDDNKVNKVNKDEVRKVFTIITDLMKGNTDAEWVASPPEWLTSVIPSQEWARQSLASRYDIYGTGVNQEAADFYALMCQHACANECKILSDSSVLPVITTGEEGRLNFASTASATIKNNTLSSDYSVIVNAIALIERSEKEYAVRLMETFINNNNSAVVEHLLGYLKEVQSRDLKGDEFRRKQDEVIGHYQSAGKYGIEYAAERAGIFLRNRSIFRIAESKREKQKQNAPLNYTNDSPSDCLRTSSSLMDMGQRSSSLADSHDELFEPLLSQACQLKYETPLKFDISQEYRDGEVKHKKYTSLPMAITQYHTAMESEDGYGSDIDFDRAYSAIESMENAIKNDDETPVATKIQVEQYKAWYYYKILKYSGKYKLSEDNKKEFNRLFNNALMTGFKLFDVDIMVTDTVTSVRNIRTSGIQKDLAGQDPEIRTQLGSLASTWGHFYSDIRPHKNQHQALYELSLWLNPSKNKSHRANIPSGKLNVVEDIEPLRLANSSSHKTSKIYYK
ncbi:MAG: hypothetical protein QS748_02330 [Candidatus Endonucleobacter bathymodioli]|uniref:Uncharacterized protein n=1 Tax=Candidatus Endonucleibacter bathymodioli TaxID=539814 RepID=A0AA90SRZ1_9GAMM|nr:hypothetical protein [Candidatus Endonucleobacter bathymodioli]